LVAQILDDFSQVIAESGARVSCNELPTIDASELELRQLMQNLIGNALKYRKKGLSPEIAVTAEKRSNGWHFKVTCDRYRESHVGPVSWSRARDGHRGCAG
jgi:light-regulated signal transduction histidine kinase (bacteriophytochrome)